MSYAINDPDYHIWGTSPIMSDDGKVHLFSARWSTNHNHFAWKTHCEIAHYVGEGPEGPFAFSDVVVMGSGVAGDWDQRSPSNPNIKQIDGTYVLTYIANSGNPFPASQRIGMLIADSLNGPWRKAGETGMVLAPSDDSGNWTYQSDCGVNNPALTKGLDGRYYLYFKAQTGETLPKKYGVAVADKLEGPYVITPEPATTNKGIIEDGYAFTYNHHYFLLTTDNHGLIEQGGGLLWRSKDGIKFTHVEQGFKGMKAYLPAAMFINPIWVKGRLFKFERPQILEIEGVPRYLYMPSQCNLEGNARSTSFILKINPPQNREETPTKKIYEPNWESLGRKKAAPEWFRDAKFGIYFHWGVYSVPAYQSEWYPRWMHHPNQPANQHHIATWGEPTEFGYEKFVPMFTAEKFDAEEWAELFKQSGARFAGPVAEHHDGFAMWDSKLTPWNAVDRGPKRDVVGEISKAIRKRDMRVITSFHHARNNLWEHKPGKWAGHFDGVKANYPEALDNPERAFMYGYMPRDQFLEMWAGKLKEVIDQYEPDIIWFDSWLHEIPDAQKMEFLAYYFNASEKWGRDVVVTFKQKDLPRSVALDDYEKGRAKGKTDFVWLTDDTLSLGSWCYTDNLKIKDTGLVLRTFIDIVSKNGQLLLNIAPMADGTIPGNQRKVLLEMGDWLRINGEAIYETRPWIIFGEGATQMKKGGHFTGHTHYQPSDVRYTKRDQTLYATFLGWPGANKKMTLRAFGREGAGSSIKIKSISLLGDAAEIAWQRTDEGLVITMPETAPDPLAVSFKLIVE